MTTSLLIDRLLLLLPDPWAMRVLEATGVVELSQGLLRLGGGALVDSWVPGA